MSAIVFSLREYQEHRSRQGFRQQIHQQVDLFLDDLESEMESSQDKLPSLFELSTQMRQTRGTLTGAILQA